MSMFRLALVVGVAIVLAACGTTGGDGGAPTPDGTSGAPGPAPDLVGSWVLESGGTPGGALVLIETHPVTLEVSAGGEVGGRAACNRYAGNVEVEGAAVTFGPLMQTEMACLEDGVMELEAAYLAALGSVSAAAGGDAGLTLTGDGVELVFRAAG